MINHRRCFRFMVKQTHYTDCGEERRVLQWLVLCVCGESSLYRESLLSTATRNAVLTGDSTTSQSLLEIQRIRSPCWIGHNPQGVLHSGQVALIYAVLSSYHDRYELLRSPSPYNTLRRDMSSPLQFSLGPGKFDDNFPFWFFPTLCFSQYVSQSRHQLRRPRNFNILGGINAEGGYVEGRYVEGGYVKGGYPE